jgi:pimeloyl-ACP methyl ester carboxylesterase
VALRSVEIDSCTVEFNDAGVGSPIMFVHGAYVTAAVWHDVAHLLSPDHRCITPTFAFGAQRRPSAPGADLGVLASGRRIGKLLELLDLTGVTLVVNDTGGGIVLSALADPPPGFERISRLVLTNCDTFEKFPPPNFAPLAWICRTNAVAGSMALRLLATSLGQRAFASAVTRHGIDAEQRARIFGGFLTSGQVRSEAVRFTAALDSRYTIAAVEGLRSWTKPVLAAWGDGDQVLTLDDARRLIDTFPDARLISISGGSTFVMLDCPNALADAIRDFAATG